MPKKVRKKPTYAFVDAANLFYGGEKSLGWKIDYQKLFIYLRRKYRVRKVFYYAGVETDGFEYSVLSGEPLRLNKLVLYLRKKLKDSTLNEAEIILLDKHIKRVKFYLKLEQFGYILRLKPTKIYWDNNKLTKKANCDVDLTFDLMRLMSQYSEAVILSGDGDFVSVLKYLMKKRKKVHILARGERTAKEIRQLAGGDFADFVRLRKALEFTKGRK